MSTQFFLRDTASDLGGAGQKTLAVTRGAAATTAITNTAVSGTDIQVTQTAAGQALTWFTGTLSAVTISGTVTVNIRGVESGAAANAGAGILVERCDGSGNVISAILADVTVPSSITEYSSVAESAKNGTFTPTSTTLAAGDRIKVTLKVRNVGTMGGSQTVTNFYDGPTAAASGDTFVTFTETITAGTRVTPLPSPVRAPVPQVFPRGRVYSTVQPAVTVAPPPAGPPFTPQPFPVRAKTPLFRAGRVTSNPGAPARNPQAGPAFVPFRQPVQAADPLPRRGRIAGISPGSPARNPHPGGAFPAWHGPVRARLPLPPRGRAASSPGAPLVTSGPGFTQFTRPVRARLPLPPRGRVSSGPGIPVASPAPPSGPPFLPAVQALRARLPAPLLKGRAASGPGVPVRNPSHGPVFTPLHWPAQARVPQNAPRGRAAGDAGGPVRNPVVSSPVVRLGTPHFRWDTEIPGFAWAAGSARQDWETGVPYGV